MATIASNALFSGTAAGAASANGISANGNSANGTSGLSPGGTGSTPQETGTFMQLVSGMIQGNTSPEQLPSNLAAFLLTGDSGVLEGLETDTSDSADTDDDDIDGDEDALFAFSALLPGLQSLPQTAAASAGSHGASATGAIDLPSRQNAMQTLLNTSQAALTAAIDDVTDDAAGDAAAATANGESSATPLNSGSHVQTLLLAHKAAEAAPQAASAEVRTPVGASGWSDEIGTHLTMMAANGREAASLRLTPEHLGPLEIRISMKDGEASVLFNASNPDTRSALEQSLPRLREMFASQGLVLGDANVSRDAPRDSFKPTTFANASRGSSDAGIEGDVKSITSARLGLVDTYV